MSTSLASHLTLVPKDEPRRGLAPNLGSTPNLTDQLLDLLPAAVYVCAPDGTILSRRITKSSGSQKWDDLVLRAIDAWRETGGLFDPTILPALVAAGYDRSFDQGQGPTVERPAASAVTCDDIVVDEDRCAVLLPHGCAIDLGGIGKGRAADLVAEELIYSGVATGGCINLGGDLRAFGRGPEDAPAWAVGLEEPDDDDSVMLVVGLADGALATSSTTRRRWRSEDGAERHHLIDPRTHEPAATGVQSVSVIAASAMRAEVHAKASLIAGKPTDDTLPMLFVHDDGSRSMFNDFEAYVW